MIIDTFGPSGGVGRCTTELVRASLKLGVMVDYVGESYASSSFEAKMGPTVGLRCHSITPSKWNPKRFIYEIRRSRNGAAHTEYALNHANLYSNARTMALINYPQVWEVPRKSSAIAIFMHDINWQVYPGNFRDPEILDNNCKMWMNRVDRIIANSEFSRQSIIDGYGISPEKVFSAPLAPWDNVQADSEQVMPTTDVPLEYDKFYLYPSTFGLHKGHDVLMAALEMATESNIYPVVVTSGMPSPERAGTHSLRRYALQLMPLYTRLLREKKLVVLHDVAEGQMNWLRRNCRSFILPTLYEGFGFPLVEAMTNCRPVICSNIPAFLEILERYAGRITYTMFPSGDANCLASILQHDAAEEQVFVKSPSTHRTCLDWNWSNTAKIILDAVAR